MMSTNYTLEIPNAIPTGTETDLNTWANNVSNLKLSNDVTPGTPIAPGSFIGAGTVNPVSMIIVVQNVPGTTTLLIIVTEANIGEAWDFTTSGPGLAPTIGLSFSLPGPIDNLDVSQVTNAIQIVKTSPFAESPNCGGSSTIISLSSGSVISPSGLLCQNAGADGQQSTIYNLSGDNSPDIPPICLAADTVIKTDQGKMLIQNITSKNTINKMAIDKLLSAINKGGDMILIKKGAFVKSRDDQFREPCNDTYITARHRVKDRNGNLVPAEALVNGDTIVHYNFGRNKPVYNVLLEDKRKPGVMIANNIYIETMCPYIYNKVYHVRRAIIRRT